MWYPPSKQQIESNTNPFRALTPEQMRQKQMQEIEEAKKVKVPSKLLKDFQKEIKNERDYQFAGTDSKEDKKEIIEDEKELLKLLRLLQQGKIEKAYDQFDRLDTALADVVPQKLLQFMDQNLDESVLESLDEIVRAKDKYPEIDKIKKVLKKKGIGFYTKEGAIMVNPANVVEARSALNKAFGGQFEKKTGMEVKADKRQSISDETELDEMKKSDGPFTIVAIKNNKVVRQFHSIEHHEIEDAIELVKTMTGMEGVKISVESKKGKIVHTEEVEQVDEGSAKDKRMMKSVKDKLTKAGIKNAVMFGEVHVAPADVKEAEKIVGDMPFKVVPQKKLEEMSAKDHYRKVMRGGRGKGFVVSSPIDRERYPDREREGLEGPYKSRKSGKIFYYDKKAGKYYDPDSDMYLDVSDVMESTHDAAWWEKKVNPKSRGWKNGTVAVNFKTFTSGGKYVSFKKGDPIFYHPMEIKGTGGRKYKVVIAADSIADADSYFSVHPDRLGLKGFDSATGPLKNSVNEAMSPFNVMGGKKSGTPRKIGKDLENTLKMTKPSEYSFSAPAADGSGLFAVIPLKRPSGQAGVMMATFDTKGSRTKVVNYYGTHLNTDAAMKFAKKEGLIESVQLDEATQHTVHVNVSKTGFRKLEAMIASLDGYRESDYSDGKARFYFDAKKHDSAERKKVAEFIKKTRGAEFSHAIKENPEYDKGLSDMNIGEINEKVMRPMGLPGKFPPKGKFTSQQIAALRKEYQKIGSVDPSSKTYENLTKFLDSLSDEMLKQLSQAKIKFISGLALNRVVKRGLKDSYEFDSKTGEYIRADGEDPLGIDGSLGRQVKESVEISEAVDEVAARELTLYIENDAGLYRQRIQPIIKNLARKMKKGTFDAGLAQKGFMYAVEHGLKNYNKEFGPGFKIDKDTKKKVAQDLLDNFMDEIEDAAS